MTAKLGNNNNILPILDVQLKNTGSICCNRSDICQCEITLKTKKKKNVEIPTAPTSSLLLGIYWMKLLVKRH